MANYLVTGAAGFIGSMLAKRLIEDGHNVVTIDNLSTGIISNLPDNITFIEGDCGDALIYSQLPDIPYDAIFHIAGQSSGEISFDDPIYDIQTNAESTLLLLKFALNNNCKHFIYAGTMSIYGMKPDRPVEESEYCKPQSFYGVAKLASEHYMRIYQQYGIKTTSLRLFNVYGPGQNLDNLRQGMISIFLAQMLQSKHIHVKGSPDRYRDFVYIDDVVEAFIRTLEYKKCWGKCINIATGVRTTVGEVIDMLVSNHDKNITVTYSGYTSGDIHGIYADTKLMQSALEMTNCLALDVGVKKMIDWAEVALP